MDFTPITIASNMPFPVRDFLNDVDSWGLEDRVVVEGEALDYAGGDLENFYEDFKLMCAGYSLSRESNQVVENTVSLQALAEYLQTVTSIDGLSVNQTDREKILTLFSPDQIPISWQNLRRTIRSDETSCVNISFLERNLRDFSRLVYYAPFERENANEAWSQQDQNNDNYIVISGLFRRALDYVQTSLGIPQDMRLDFQISCWQPTETVASSRKELKINDDSSAPGPPPELPSSDAVMIEDPDRVADYYDSKARAIRSSSASESEKSAMLARLAASRDQGAYYTLTCSGSTIGLDALDGHQTCAGRGYESD